MIALPLQQTTRVVLVLALTLAGMWFLPVFTGRVTTATSQSVLTISGKVTELHGTPVPNVTMTFSINFDGYNFWLTKLNQFHGNFVDAEMVKAFIVSSEYIQRFGP